MAMTNDCLAVDFFCGCGGMTAGLKKAGIEVRLGLDIDPSCRETYEGNNQTPFHCMDLRDLSPRSLSRLIGKRGKRPLLFAGCAPCQPFSKVRKSGIRKHPDADLLDYFLKFVLVCRPDYVLCENVPQLCTPSNGRDIPRSFLSSLEKFGYATDMRVINAIDFGVPQNRRRLVMIASRRSKKIKIPEGPTKNFPITVRQAIEDLPVLVAGQRDPIVANHWASSLSELNLARIKAVPKDGGDLRNVPENLRPSSRKYSSIYGHGGFYDVYGRMKWDEPAPTLTTRCNSYSNGRYGHPEQDRAISLREAARLQSFDDSYVFHSNVVNVVAKMIGNAVPVNMAYHLARCFMER